MNDSQTLEIEKKMTKKKNIEEQTTLSSLCLNQKSSENSEPGTSHSVQAVLPDPHAFSGIKIWRHHCGALVQVVCWRLRVHVGQGPSSLLDT